MSIELISHPLCPYVHRAAALLHEKGVPHTVRYIDLAAKPEWFHAISPRGKVPVLVVDGTALFESAAIVEFLDETRAEAPHVVPTDPLARARARAWVEVANDLFMAHYKLVIAPPADRATALATLSGILARFEGAIEGPLFGGPALGLVDIATGPGLVRLERTSALLGLDLYAGFLKVAAWSAAINARPSFRGSVPDDFDERFAHFVRRDAA